MFDLRPIGYVIGLFVSVLGVAMVPVAIADALSADSDWRAFSLASIITLVFGLGMILTCGGGRRDGMSIQQTFILTTVAWIAMPLFGALPFMFSGIELSFVDAVFEAVSGITTTGATVLEGLDTTSAGVLLWRGILQWIGGIGILVVAIAILPQLQVGGMQLFRSEAFDTFGKILPRAAAIATQLGYIYLGLTIAAILVYAACGMEPFDALVHAMTTIATGGLSNYDASMGHFDTPSIHYSAAVFMLLSALPYVRFVQLLNGSARPLLRDPQVRTFFLLVALVVAVLSYLKWTLTGDPEASFRSALFNTISIITGTGYATEDYSLWGPFAMMVFFLISLSGGCAGSTSCSVKIFRYQVLAAAIRAQIRAIHNPSSVVRARYDGRPISEQILSSVMAFFMLFLLSLAVITLVLSLIGLDFLTALSGAVATLGNVGPGLGDTIGPSGNYASLPVSAKWTCIVAMIIGRLELLSVFVMLAPGFWRR